MVLSINIPLKASDEAIVKFLLGLVFSQKKQNAVGSRRECLNHDVQAASKLISWILQNDKKNLKSYVVVCNLVYGNAIVLGAQVSRLLLDAIRAKDTVAYSTFQALEKERKRKTIEMMEQMAVEYNTPKKMMKSKRGEEIKLSMPTPSPISQALKQNITMPDTFAMIRDEELFQDDDLAPITQQQLDQVGWMYGNLNESNHSDIPMFDKTFIDRLSSEPIIEDLNETIQFQRPSDEFIGDQQLTPRKDRFPAQSPVQDDFFLPAPTLKDILVYAHIPLAEGDQRKSMEDEMEEVRSRAINSDQADSQEILEVPRILSERMELDNDDDIIVPQKTPRSLVRRAREIEDKDGNNNAKVPLREMDRLMKDFSSLIYPSAKSLIVKKPTQMGLRDLMLTVPFCLRKHADKELWNLLVPTHSGSHHDMEAHEEEEEEEPGLKRKRHRAPSVELEPIDLSNMKIVMTPLKERQEEIEPLKLDELELELPRQQPQEDLNFTPPRPVSTSRLQEETSPRRENYSPINERAPAPERINADEKSIESLREDIMNGCHADSPFTFKLDSLILPDITRREAARIFYASLELLKEHKIVAVQKAPFAVIELGLNHCDSDDIENISLNNE
uniref:Rad21_Rec8 domain-containing protein n=1 Tax=Caenorhabditis japonica TaxID=281687 RepID=A0A8R1DSU0_CAEJA